MKIKEDKKSLEISNNLNNNIYKLIKTCKKLHCVQLKTKK